MSPEQRRERDIAAGGHWDPPNVGPLMRRSADDAGVSWRKSWGLPTGPTVPDLLDVYQAHRADDASRELHRAVRILFWFLCIDLGAMVGALVVR